MDFKTLISKIESIDGPIETVNAPQTAEPIRLDEDTELRVLAGVTTLTESVIAEKAVSKAQQKAMGAALAAKRGDIPKSELKGASKEMSKMSEKELEKYAGTKHKGLPEKVKKEDIEVSEEMKVGDTKKSSTGGTIEKTKTGIKHTAKEYDGEDHKEPAQSKPSKAAKSSAEKKGDKELDKKEKQKSKDWEKRFGKGSVTKHTMKDESIDPEQFKAKFSKMVEEAKEEDDKKKAAAEKKKKEEKKKKIAKIVDEGSKPDFLDLDKDGNKKEPMKKAAADKGGDKKEGKKGMTAKQEKYFGKKNESIDAKKEIVAESVEPKLSLKDMLRIVKESGGQQAIDPVDQTLWSWANRVASSKIQESQKAEIFAAMIYERNGGRFEMYDVLAEDRK